MKKKHWQLAGNVFADRQKEKHLAIEKGTGILVYQPQKKQAHLTTLLQHGDIDVELDFLLSKGAATAIAFQGRYLVALKDSWLQNNLTPTDCGGIAAGATGVAPAMNATKAPGLWQHIKISFKAPRFDAAGKKVADARFVEVTLNGKTIQQQVAVNAPSVTAPLTGESELAPLMFLAGSGPVAFKNIQYKTYAAPRLLLSDVQYKIYKGRFRQLDKLPTSAPIKSGQTDSLSHRISDEDELIIFEGEMEAPRNGDYLFRASAAGPTWLFIEDKMILDNKGSRDYERFYYSGTSLTAGKHPFKLIFSNHDQSLVMEYEGPNIPWTTLTTPASQRMALGQEPLVYQVKNKPVIQRGFMLQNQATNTFAAAVGIPGGVNYAYDLNAYTPLKIWHGNYLDVGLMWRERGEKQLEKPLGAELELSGLPTVVTLAGQQAAWPDTVKADASIYSNKGYKLRPNGLPEFYYSLGKVDVADYLAPTAQQEGLVREINIRFREPNQNTYCLLASGTNIEKLANGSYAVSNKSYYLENLETGGTTPIIRNNNGKAQLLLPLNEKNNNTLVKYSIVW